MRSCGSGGGGLWLGGEGGAIHVNECNVAPCQLRRNVSVSFCLFLFCLFLFCFFG